jgi:hypothetical protein
MPAAAATQRTPIMRVPVNDDAVELRFDSTFTALSPPVAPGPLAPRRRSMIRSGGLAFLAPGQIEPLAPPPPLASGAASRIDPR